VPVDVGLARLSNQLVNGATVAYSLAFLGYAIETAYGTHARGAVGTRLRAPVVTMPALVGAGARAGGGAGLAADAAEAQADADAVDTDAGAALPPSAGGAPGRPRTSASALQAGLFATVVTVIGWVLHLGALVTRGASVHRLPWGNMYEFTLALTFAATTAFLVISMRQRVRYLGTVVMAMVAISMAIAMLVLYVPAAPLMPALHSYWLGIHVTAAIIASGVFTVATAATMMFLVADRYAMRVAAGKPVRFAKIARLMPEPETLDRTAYRAYAFAFPIWTFAVIAGAIWAEYAWGHYWQWDPKETWAFITWVVYAGYLHARATAGWRGRKAAYVAMLGFATILFNYFVVNIFISGMHSYAGI
jgi:cytochrome c-type biogenesis protein CcsB